MRKKPQTIGKHMYRANKIGRGIVICLWVGIVIFLLIHRDEVTIEKIVGFTPQNTLLAILAMLVLFTIKGCTVFMNGSVLFAACGVMFSLPLAVTVNMLGSLIMTTIPYWTGRKGGAAIMERLTQKYRKLELLRSAPRENQFLFALLLRILGLLPCEVVSMYLGSCRLRYSRYIAGTLLGLLPAAVAFSIIGEYASDPTSPQFIAAAAFQVTTTICTLIEGGIWKRKKKTNQERVSVCSK